MNTNNFARLLVALVLGAVAMAGANPVLAEPEFELRGRLHLDYGLHDDDEIDLDDGFAVRRTRIGAQGTINEDWSAIIEYDFAENETSAQDIILRRKLGEGTLKLGHFKVPVGMAQLSSTNNIPFLERGAATALTDGYRLGVGYEIFSGALGFQAMAYGRELDGDQPGDDPLGFGARLIHAPRLAGNQVHLGVSFAWEGVRDYDVQRYRERPEARVDGTRLIDTGDIAGVERTAKYGLEAAFQNGPFVVQAEYLGARIERTIGREPNFSGGYVQGSWMLTGETRGYRGGVFRGATPHGAGGAWEIAARYSTLDLIDAGFQGGKQENLTLGLNYYANVYVRFMLNYIMVDVTDSGAAVDGVTVGEESPRILIGRVQFYF